MYKRQGSYNGVIMTKKKRVIRFKTSKGKDVTFKLPIGITGWYKWFRGNSEVFKSVRYIGVGIAMLTVIGMHDVFQQIQFSQDVMGTLIWAMVLLGMSSMGFK